MVEDMYDFLKKDVSLNFDAVFSDESETFVSPNEPRSGDDVTIKIRVLKNNIDAVFLVSKGVSYKMNLSSSDKLFSYYTFVKKNIKETFSYHFLIKKGNDNFYFSKYGVASFIDPHYNFNIIPDFITPNWAKSAVMYQIYVDRFYNGDTSNDVKTFEYTYLGRPVFAKNWNDDITVNDVWTFYGGDLQGVIDKVSYLEDLGVECIYFNPLFVSPSNHKYDISDYDYVDPHIGVIVEDNDDTLEFEKMNNKYAEMYKTRTTSKKNLEASNQLLIDLINIFHERNIKVILDGVFNHCGSFNKWLDTEGFYVDNPLYEKGAYHDEKSKYHDYFHWLSDEWDPDEYDGWWGYKNHPKLNFEGSKELEDYIMEVGRKWVSPPFNADGWRLDVAADLGLSEEYNHKFWQKFRNAVKTANPESIIIAEHYGSPKPWLDGTQWDTIMNYDAFMEPITWFLTGMEKHSEEHKPEYFANTFELVTRMRYNMAFFSAQSLYTSMNQLSNHDHSRFLTRTNGYAGRLHIDGKEKADQNIKMYIMYQAIVMQMTWVGSPTLYYGDEVGVTGFTDPDNRRTFPWGHENYELLDFYKLAIRIHKRYDALRYGSIKLIYSEYGILVYSRFTENQKIIVIINNNNESRKLLIPVWNINSYDDKQYKLILESKVDCYIKFYRYFNVKNGHLNITIDKNSSMILVED